MKILSWKDADKLLALCNFIAVTRPGYDAEKLKKKMNDIQMEYDATIHVLNVPGVAISSTEIRQRCSEGKSIKYLLPEPVEEFIMTQGLYKKHKG